jgi:hypothetical protein
MVVALGTAFAWTMQGGGAPQNSNYALVRALADGTAQIDRTRGEVGEAGTNDVVFHEGHVYSNKAPGLAFLSLPLFMAADAAGLVPQENLIRSLWLLTLWGVVVPAIVLLLLVRSVVERFEPGLGLPVAALLGTATLLLPFASVFFAHVLAALLLFGSFVLLSRGRNGPLPLVVVAASGLLAGLTVLVEYQSVLAAPALGLYALWRGARLRGALAFGASWLAGIVPLLVYNEWAFGSFRRLSYGFEAGERNYGSLEFIGVPSLRQGFELLVSTNGLLVLMPLFACAVAGLVLAYRTRYRAEALVGAGVLLAYFVYDSGYYSPFGGLGPPRFFVPVLPFLALPLAAFLRRLPFTTIVATLISATIMTTLTATYVLASYDSQWLSRLSRGDVPLTVTSLVGVTGWYAIVPFFLAVAGALAIALAATRVVVTMRDAWAALGLAAAWAIVAAGAPQPVDMGGRAGEYGAYGSAGAVAAVGLALLIALRFARTRETVSRDRRAVASR